MDMEELEEYVEMMCRTAERLWGSDDAEKMHNHIETTASAVYRIGQLELDTKTEPVTRLWHREQS